MKARKVRIDGVEAQNLIALIEESGNWSVITTIPAARNFRAAYAFRDELGFLRQNGEVLAVEEDVEFVSEEFEVELGAGK